MPAAMKVRYETEIEAGGTVVPPKDVPAIKAALEDFLGKYERHELPVPKEEVVNRFNRVTLTLSLVKVFESLMVV